MENVNKVLVSQRKKVYGNNFPDMSKTWGEYIDAELTPEQAAYMMYLLKVSRENHIIRLLENYTGTEENLKKLNDSLEDTRYDKNSYLWISNNYEEYLSL